MKLAIGREPSDPELAHYLEMPVEKLRQYTQSAMNVVSLENPLRPTNSGKTDTDTRTLGDTIVSDAPSPLEESQIQCLRQDLEQVLLDALTPTERAVMMARYGLQDGHSKTLEETARMVGVSRERVRLVEAKALNKLRSPQTNYRLKTYLGGCDVSAAKKILSKKNGKSKKADASWSATKAAAASLNAANNENMANPFALPFEYQRRSSIAVNGAEDGKATKSSLTEQEHEEEEEAASSSAGPNRLWFL